MATATEREAARIITEARRRLRRRVTTLVAVALASGALIAVLSALVSRATRWKGELLRSGVHTAGVVVDVHTDDGTKNVMNRVSIDYSVRGETRSFEVSPGRLTHYGVGDAVDVIYDPSSPDHVRTPWDARRDPWEDPIEFAIIALVLVGLGAVLMAPRATIGLRLARGEWIARTVVERAGWSGKFQLDAYDFSEDRLYRVRPAMFDHGGAPERGRMLVAGNGRWRVVARPGVTDVARRSRTALGDRLLRRRLGLRNHRSSRVRPTGLGRRG